MIVDPLIAGGAAAGVLKTLDYLQRFLHTNGNGNGNGNGKAQFTQSDHDALKLAAERQSIYAQQNERAFGTLSAQNEQGFRMLHDDLQTIAAELRSLRDHVA